MSLEEAEDAAASAAVDPPQKRADAAEEWGREELSGRGTATRPRLRAVAM